MFPAREVPQLLIRGSEIYRARRHQQHRARTIQHRWRRLDPGRARREHQRSLEERYEFSLRELSPGEHTIAVRAYDHFDNVGSAKSIVKVPPANP